MSTVSAVPDGGQGFREIAAEWREFCAHDHKYVDDSMSLAIVLLVAVADPAEHFTGDLIQDAVTVLRSTADRWKAEHDTCASIGGAEIESLALRLGALAELRRRERFYGGAR